MCVPLSCLFEGPSSVVVGFIYTNRHDIAAFGQTYARGGTLDLLMTDVPDLVQVAAVAPLGTSGHSSLSAVISMAQAWIDD